MRHPEEAPLQAHGPLPSLGFVRVSPFWTTAKVHLSSRLGGLASCRRHALGCNAFLSLALLSPQRGGPTWVWGEESPWDEVWGTTRGCGGASRQEPLKCFPEIPEMLFTPTRSPGQGLQQGCERGMGGGSVGRVESSPCHGLLSLSPASPMKARLGPEPSPEPRPKHTGILQKPASTLGSGDLRRPERTGSANMAPEGGLRVCSGAEPAWQPPTLIVGLQSLGPLGSRDRLPKPDHLEPFYSFLSFLKRSSN